MKVIATVHTENPSLRVLTDTLDVTPIFKQSFECCPE